MNKESIIHFVGFITQLERKFFASQWIAYASIISPGRARNTDVLQESNVNARYKYISQHEFSEEGFSFSFMKDRSSENFPDQKARVVMLGGYMLTETAQEHHNKKTDTRMLVFLDRDMHDTESCCSIFPPSSLTIYEPFYENCLYGLILEFTGTSEEIKVFSEILQHRKELIEFSIYRTCNIASVVA